MLHNIPLELRRRPQWVAAQSNKIPFDPKNPSELADPTDPATWGTFEQAVACGMLHVGYVLSPDDPYSAIDLDAPINETQEARHTEILEVADSYTELSQSGKGVHIFLRGKIPNGVRRDNVEVYSQGRYMICTGHILDEKPIREDQALLDYLYGKMQSTASSVKLEDKVELLTDEELWQMGHDAVNGAKFDQLWEGNWQNDYPSHSEADFALMSMICYYSKANDQCRRVFRLSELGKRDKAQRDAYLNYMIKKSRAKEPPTVDLETIHALSTTSQNHALPPAPPPRKTPPAAPPLRVPPPESGLSRPPGLIGDVADYFYACAIRPVREIALVGALAFVAGIVGRSYNISGTGLNQYFVLLAKTGRGKEGLASGVNKLVAAVRTSVPLVDRFLGPAAFASGQALIRVLDERPCFVSILGEFASTLEGLTDPRANDGVKMLKRALLDLYNKSGHDQIIRPSVYSDTDKNTKAVQAPNVTILGESTPSEFLAKLDSSHISSGLLSRFSVVEYDGPRPPRNPNAFVPPSAELTDRIGDLVTIALTTQQNTTVCAVETDPDAMVILNSLDHEADRHINTSDDITAELWNRTHLKALKLAALLAVGCNPEEPVVNAECARWASDFVKHDVKLLSGKFADGEVGDGQAKQEADLIHTMRDYFSMRATTRTQYKVPAKLIGEQLVPYHFLRRRLRNVASFKNDRRGFRAALDDMLSALIQAETIVQLDRRIATESFGVTSPIYAKGPNW